MGLFIVGAGGGCFSEAGFDHGSSGLRGFFTFEIARRWRSESEPYFKPSHFPRARVEPLLPHSRHRQAPALPYFPSICGHSDFPSLWNQYFPSRAYYGSSCFLAVQLIFGNFLDFEFFRILANVTKLSFSFFQVFACLGHGQRESCNRDCVTFVKAQILTETSFGSFLELDTIFARFGRNQLNLYLGCCLLPATFFNRI